MRKALHHSCASLLACGVAVAQASAQAVAPAPLAGGEVTFLFHSTFVGRLSGRAPVASAEFRGDELRAVRGSAEVRVADMRTGNGTRDRHLRETMAADSYPAIRFDLADVRPTSTARDTVAIAADGRLTLHGVTRPVSARGTVVLKPGETDVELTFPLDMRDYGIKPPVRALVLRVGPDVAVTARLTFGQPRSP